MLDVCVGGIGFEERGVVFEDVCVDVLLCRFLLVCVGGGG